MSESEGQTADQRDFNTDDIGRYPQNFLRSQKEGRTYEDLQSPEKIRLREIIRRFEDMERYLSTYEKMLRTKIEVTFTSTHATSDLDILHKLETVPSDVLISVPGADTRIWKGSTEWTRTNIYLRASAACTVTLYLVV